MKSKVINLFGDKTIIQNGDVKYSELLDQFITPFESDFSEIEFYEDVVDFAINAWNFGNMKTILPKGESDAVINAVKDKDVDINLLKKMIDFKVKRFKEHTNFIVDYQIEKRDEDSVLSVITQEQDLYLSSMFENMEADSTEKDFEENYINRTAIILKPLQPFLDWGSNLYPEEIDDLKGTATYLISEDIDDVEAWLKKKFDKLFIRELEGWHTNKKEWPQKRNYKMFKQWFQVDVSILVYDLEKEPVFKF